MERFDPCRRRIMAADRLPQFMIPEIGPRRILLRLQISEQIERLRAMISRIMP